MEIAEWLDAREPSPPERLSGRIRAELAASASLDSTLDPGLLAEAGIAIVHAIGHTGSSDRSTALDLLAADALVTYAFEASAESVRAARDTARLTLELLRR